MKPVRIAGAAFLVFLGAMLLVAWSVAGKAVASIEDGSAATKLTQKLLDDPGFADAAAGRITDRLVERTEGRFIQKIIVAFEPEIQRGIAQVLASDRVDEAVTNSVSKLEEQLTAEITDPDRASAPFVISIDLSDRVNARIDEIPVVGAFIPEVTVPPIERELMDAETFDSVRQVYSALKFVAGWGIVFAIALIVAGFYVAPRSRWYWPGALIGAAFVVLAISIAVRRVIPASIANAVPGGETGGSGTFLSNFVADNATGPIASRLLGMALWAAVLAVLFAVVARYLPGWKERFVPVAATADAVVANDAAPVTAVSVEPADVVVAGSPEAETFVVTEVVEEPAPVTKPATRKPAAKKPAEEVPAPKKPRTRKPAPPKE
jgi:hypothetical protein